MLCSFIEKAVFFYMEWVSPLMGGAMLTSHDIVNLGPNNNNKNHVYLLNIELLASG